MSRTMKRTTATITTATGGATTTSKQPVTKKPR
jgi:hypothetical protein